MTNSLRINDNEYAHCFTHHSLFHQADFTPSVSVIPLHYSD
ncbi:hypothetical protein [Porphyromonas gingivalis]|nr:hypothetical protein [Porphyromonas gingivalis]